MSRIGEVDGDGIGSLESLPAEADAAYRLSDALEFAGRPGFGFARVLVGAGGERMVPHFAAVDVASDNRLLPQQSWTSEHQFQTPCEDPEVIARLIHRPYPLALARERGWEPADQVMVEVRE